MKDRMSTFEGNIRVKDEKSEPRTEVHNFSHEGRKGGVNVSFLELQKRLRSLKPDGV